MSGRFIFGIIDTTDHFGLSLRVIGNHHLDRIQHGHTAFSAFVKVLADTEFQQSQVDHVIALGHTHLVGKHPDALGGISPAAQPANRRHTGIVPSHDDSFLHALEQLTLAHHRIGQVQTGKLVLMAFKNTELLNEPVV